MNTRKLLKEESKVGRENNLKKLSSGIFTAS
jgi:hypothetical protein